MGLKTHIWDQNCHGPDKRGIDMAGLMARYDYESDDGFTYAIRMDSSNALSAANSPATATVGLPGRYKPRYILAQSPTTGRERKIVICDPANPLWVGGDSAIDLPNFDAAMAVQSFAVRGRIGERRLAV